MPIAHADHRYIEGLRRNNHRLVAELYERHAGTVLNYVLKNNGSSSEASDVFQEVILVLLASSRRENFVLTCPIGAFIYRLARNKWIDRLRAKKRSDRVSSELAERWEYEEDAGQQLIAAEDAARRDAQKREAFQQLSELCQKIMRRQMDGESPETIVRALEMNSMQTLYRRKKACIDRWKELIERATTITKKSAP